MQAIVKFWILISTIFCAAGWLLSLLHQLNELSYGVVLLLIGLGMVAGWWQWVKAGKNNWRPACHRLLRRFRKPVPLLFLLLVFLAFFGGAFYPPDSGDPSMYRTPRVLHWLAEGHWHWIRTFDTRLNTRGCGFEWLTAPLLALTKTDRLFFLINLVSYALLPGLIFSVFRQLRMSGQTAWWWMWLLPAGWCYALSAGSVVNDSYAAVYALAAVNLALRAAKTGCLADFWLSWLAVCLLTGVKQTLIPLALLWLIAAAPALRLLRQRPLATLVMVIIGLSVSALPMICLNLSHDANWAGIPKHPDPMDPWAKLQMLASPAWGVMGNSFCLLVQNFAPPFNPLYENWNGLMQQLLQTSVGHHFKSFEAFGKLPPYSTSQTAGLGPIFCLLLSATLFGAWWRRGRNAREISPSELPFNLKLLRLVPWMLLLLFMATIGSFESARMLSPYYPFLLPALLTQPAYQQLVRCHWWRKCAGLCMFSTVALMIFAPNRPLWPALTLFDALQRAHPESKAIARLRSVYSGSEVIYIERHIFALEVPPTEQCIGYATDIRGLEPGLWRPFTRKVQRVLPGDKPEYLQKQNIHYVVVDAHFLELTGGTIDQLMKNYNARLVSRVATSNGLGRPPSYVYLIQLLEPPAPAASGH